ncbi:MAG: acetolactate synthase small subunit [Oscillospiraceae bacterium]|nr:acetolactate synthase small subunit [Oscillospiraceae bacterium]
MKGDRSQVFTLMVDNEFGVLTRITALIRRAGWNIRSLAVAQTALPEISRLTICLECRHHSFESVLDKLGRQSCVRDIAVFEADNQIARELAILRFRGATEAFREKIVTAFGAILAEEPDSDSCIYTLCCEDGELDGWLPVFVEGGLVDIARTGTVALKRRDDEVERGPV